MIKEHLAVACIFLSLVIAAQTDTLQDPAALNVSNNRGICATINFLHKFSLGNEIGTPAHIEAPHHTFKYGEIAFSITPKVMPYIGYYLKNNRGNYHIMEAGFYAVKRDYGNTIVQPYHIYSARYTFNYIGNKRTKLRLHYNLAASVSFTGTTWELNGEKQDATKITYNVWRLFSNGLIFRFAPNLLYKTETANFTFWPEFNLFSIIQEHYYYNHYSEPVPPHNPAILPPDTFHNKEIYFRWAGDYFKSSVLFNSMGLRAGYNF